MDARKEAIKTEALSEVQLSERADAENKNLS